jgi:hypothetical protein
MNQKFEIEGQGFSEALLAQGFQALVHTTLQDFRQIEL